VHGAAKVGTALQWQQCRQNGNIHQHKLASNSNNHSRNLKIEANNQPAAMMSATMASSNISFTTVQWGGDR